MKKSIKTMLIIVSVLIVIILFDTMQAKVFNNSPIIKVTKNYSSYYKKDVGILVETDIFGNEEKKTYFKWETRTLPIKEITED